MRSAPRSILPTESAVRSADSRHKGRLSRYRTIDYVAHEGCCLEHRCTGSRPGAGGLREFRICGAAVPQIVAENVGQPVGRLQEAFGEPRKIDTSAANPIYVWFFPQSPAGAPSGFHGCEMEVTVDGRSQRILGYSSSNIGWSKCRDIERRIRVAGR